MCDWVQGGGVRAATDRGARACARDAYMENTEKERQAAAEAASASVRSQFQAATGTGNNQESGGGSNRF